MVNFSTQTGGIPFDDAYAGEWLAYATPARDIIPRQKDSYLMMPRSCDLSFFSPDFGNMTQAVLRGNVQVSLNSVGRYVSLADETRRKVNDVINPELSDPYAMSYIRIANGMKKLAWEIIGYGAHASNDIGAYVAGEGNTYYFSTNGDFGKLRRRLAANYGSSEKSAGLYIILHELMHLNDVREGTAEAEASLEAKRSKLFATPFKNGKSGAMFSDAFILDYMNLLRGMEKIAKSRQKTAHQTYGHGSGSHIKARYERGAAYSAKTSKDGKKAPKAKANAGKGK